MRARTVSWPGPVSRHATCVLVAVALLGLILVGGCSGGAPKTESEYDHLAKDVAKYQGAAADLRQGVSDSQEGAVTLMDWLEEYWVEDESGGGVIRDEGVNLSGYVVLPEDKYDELLQRARVFDSVDSQVDIPRGDRQSGQ